jgi:hypothetical protein
MNINESELVGMDCNGYRCIYTNIEMGRDEPTWIETNRNVSKWI